MRPEEVQLEQELLDLWLKLQSLHKSLRDYTIKKFNRVNPFNENLFNWHEKGAALGSQNTTIYDSATIVGDVKIGDNTWIGPFVSLDGTGGLTVGSYCSISAGVQILTHDTVLWALSAGQQEYEYASVSIGDCCFIGVQSVIIKGTQIGKHCLIAANSVVRGNIPDFSIIGGNPAKVIGQVVFDESDKICLCYQ